MCVDIYKQLTVIKTSPVSNNEESKFIRLLLFLVMFLGGLETYMCSLFLWHNTHHFSCTNMQMWQKQFFCIIFPLDLSLSPSSALLFTVSSSVRREHTISKVVYGLPQKSCQAQPQTVASYRRPTWKVSQLVVKSPPHVSKMYNNCTFTCRCML